MNENEIDRDDLVAALNEIAQRPDALRALDSQGPIFPLAHREDLEDELALTELAIDRLGEGLVIDRTRLMERRQRLEWWAARIRRQLADTSGGLSVGLIVGLTVSVLIWMLAVGGVILWRMGGFPW